LKNDRHLGHTQSYPREQIPPNPSAIQTGAFGMQTIDTALRNLFRSGVISKETAEAQAHDKRFVVG
jgi:Tfp pilus assembly pilus retraction ATPase PilT